MINTIIKKLVATVLFTITLSTAVFAVPNVEINVATNNVSTIKINNIEYDIVALQLDLTDSKANTNYIFTPSVEDVDNFIKEYDNNGNTLISLLLDSGTNFSKDILASAGSFDIGDISSSKEPFFQTTAKLILIDKNLNKNLYDVKVNTTYASSSKQDNSSGNISNDANNINNRGSGANVSKQNENKIEESVDTDKEDAKNNNEEQVNTIDHSQKYSDIDGHWAKKAIVYLSEKGILNGVSENSFKPNDNIKRAEFVTILAQIDKINKENFSTSTFKDVEKNAWFNPYVAWAVERGITSGISKDNFSPNEFITREQMAVMMYRFFKYKNYELKTIVSEVNFNDASQISSYAVDAIKAMQQAGIISGKGNNTFEPKDNAKRSEVAQMIYTMLINIGK